MNFFICIILIALGLDALGINSRFLFAKQLDAETAVKKFYSKISGVPLTKKHPRYKEFLEAAQKSNFRLIFDAASDPKEQPGFYSTTVKKWASLTLNKDKDPALGFNDALATMMGAVRDNLDARTLLTGDYLYGAVPQAGKGKPSPFTNAQYEEIEAKHKPLINLISKYEPQWDLQDYDEPAGLLTSRYWGETFYSGGTNRRAVVGTFDVFMCTPIETWRTAFLPTKWIRRDVTRAPSGDVMAFQHECRTCHAPMDALSTAFVFYDFKNDALVKSSEIQAKYLQHEDAYDKGFVPAKSDWQNYLTASQNKSFGWRTPLNGRGLRDFAKMISESEGFSNCLTKRVFREVCRKNLDVNHSTIKRLAREFEQKDQYKLKDLFYRVAVDQECSDL